MEHFPVPRATKLGNFDSCNLTCAVALATLDRWNIPHPGNVAYITRAEVRNLLREWFGPKSVRIQPAGRGAMEFALLDGSIHVAFDEPETWEGADGLPGAGNVRLTVKGIER